MRTYNSIPVKYESIEPRTIKVIGEYAYMVKRAAYSGQRDYVYRITTEEYNKLRKDAQYWDIYKCDPSEKNLQRQIWSYIVSVSEAEPYLQTTKYF
jgi:hypothetical protein